MKRIAQVLGCTEGQAYTLTIGVALAGLLLAGTVPATLRDRPIASASQAIELAVTPTPWVGRSATSAETQTDAPEVTTPTTMSTARARPTAPPRDAVGGGSAVQPSAGGGSQTSSAVTATTGPSTPVPAPADRSGDVPEASSVPLAVLEGGWATTGAGTPAARTGVPPDTLPVASTAGGSTTRRSFVRLRGTAPVLVLRVRTESGATVNDTGAAVLACVITDPGWTPAEAIALEAAPPFDPKRCATGVRQSDGSWRFDLGAFADRSGRAGFTLIPDPARVTTPFQLAYDPTSGASP